MFKYMLSITFLLGSVVSQARIGQNQKSIEREIGFHFLSKYEGSMLLREYKTVEVKYNDDEVKKREDNDYNTHLKALDTFGKY